MDIRYMKYVRPGCKYYVRMESENKNEQGYVLDLPKSWEKFQDNHWMYCMNIENTLPVQGWKIHISSNIREIKTTLAVIAPYLIKKGISFKYVKNEEQMLLKNSKYGDRGSSGKFITIYPKNEKEFSVLLDELNHLLSGISKGPYILSDKRWKNGNVYYRYGAFKEMFTIMDGMKVLAIRTPEGNYIPDLRNPFYSLPDFVVEPSWLLEGDEEDTEEMSELSKYEITEALHFSNGGGVYKAIELESKDVVIIKEGRPEAGVDAMQRDAVERVIHEGEVLQRLALCNYVVSFKGLFKEWEHVFLVEEFLEGCTLQEWVAINYPFDKTNIFEYKDKAIRVLEQLIDAVEKMHRLGIGMGDLQPANVMIQKDDTVKLIDFEVADDLLSDQPTGLITPGFVSAMAKTREQSDWFALLRISKFLFLPIGAVQEITEEILPKHYAWIENEFGSDPFECINYIEHKCHAIMNMKMMSDTRSHIKYWKLDDIEDVIQGLRASCINSLEESERLAPGDIRQYELEGGLYNVLTGGYGVILALLRSGNIPERAIKWIDKYGHYENINVLDDGLFTGKSGVAGVLFEAGYADRAKKILDSISVDKLTSDISLISGLSGIGLTFLSVSMHKGFEDYLKKAIDIAAILEDRLINKIVPQIIDPDFINIGLLDGWSGAALFYCAMYNCIGDEKWLNLSIQCLEKDLEQCIFDDEGGFQVKDRTRALPYLQGGSAGIGLVIIELQHSLKCRRWDKELEGIAKVTKSKCYYNVGLFRGTMGLFTLANALNIGTNIKVDIKKDFNVLNLFLTDMGDGKIGCPGDYSFRLSEDIFSGSMGVMLALQDYIRKEWLSWLPIPRSKEKFLCGLGGAIYEE